MSLYTILFYIIAALIIAATALAITRRHMVHAVLYLVISFLGSALLFFLLGAPLLAILEVIIYAGAIMVLFLFIVMMLKIEPPEKQALPFRHYAAAGAICGVYFLAVILLTLFSEEAAMQPMTAAMATPEYFGLFLFGRHWLAIEIISLLLLIALVGALHLGLGRARKKSTQGGRK